MALVTLIFWIILPLAVPPEGIEDGFSPKELDEMGVCLEYTTQ